MKWHPSRAQWAVIWSTFAIVSYLLMWPYDASWLRHEIERSAYDSLAWLVTVGGALWVWWLQGRRARR